MTQSKLPLLDTKEVASQTGLSPSFFERGRCYGYGPAFIKIRGRVRYRQQDVEIWMETQRHIPGGASHD